MSFLTDDTKQMVHLLAFSSQGCILATPKEGGSKYSLPCGAPEGEEDLKAAVMRVADTRGHLTPTKIYAIFAGKDSNNVHHTVYFVTQRANQGQSFDLADNSWASVWVLCDASKSMFPDIYRQCLQKLMKETYPGVA